MLAAISWGGGGSYWQTGEHGESAGGTAPDPQLAADEREPRVGVAHPDIDASGAGVLEDVGCRLLEDSIGGEVEGGCQHSCRTIDPGVDLQSSGTEFFDQERELCDAGLRTPLGSDPTV